MHFKKLISALCALIWLKSIALNGSQHRVGGHLGGMFWVIGGGFSAGASYQWVFHRNLALDIDANYNFSMALGTGPYESGGVDVSLDTLLYNFGARDFSKGVGVSFGLGAHYLVDSNPNLFLEKVGDIKKPGFGSFLVYPLSLGVFYYHLFEQIDRAIPSF